MEREGKSGQIGAALLEQQAMLFSHWHKVRDGTLSRADFIPQAEKISEQVKLLEAACYEAKKGDKSPMAQTVRTCRELLKLEPAMWLFVRAAGVEPIMLPNRRAVLWRKNSFGTQSAAGSLLKLL